METLKTFQLKRANSSDEGTAGEITLTRNGLPVHVCYVMELPNRNNKSNLSRIPSGTYLVNYLKRSVSGKYRDIYHITNVPMRGGILMHSGNWTGDTIKGYKTHSHGCVLPCLRLGTLAGQKAGLASRGGLKKLHKFTGRKSFYLEVI